MTDKRNINIFSGIPNCITIIGLICGVLAVVFSFECDNYICTLKGYEWTWIFIGIALICDFCDGLSARLLNAYSELGKNLDSLSDLVSFGLAPCFLIYNIITNYHTGWSFIPYITLIIPVTGALRLARFNIDPNQKTVFNGLPIPANAIFWIGFSPLLIENGEMPAWITVLALIVISFLMITPMPMFSLKIKNLSLADISNVLRLILIVTTIILIVFLRIQGLMWAILVYILLSMWGFSQLSKSK